MAPSANINWSKWWQIFSLFRWTGTLPHRKTEKTYLRDKQGKYPTYASRNNNLLQIGLMATNWSDDNNENSNSSHFYCHILILRFGSLRSDSASSAGKRTFSSLPIEGFFKKMRILAVNAAVNLNWSCCLFNMFWIDWPMSNLKTCDTCWWIHFFFYFV